MAESNGMTFLQKHDFLLRRLHSLTGIVPIGVFLIAHLTTNSSLLWGKYALRGHASDYAFSNDGVSLSEGGIAYFQKEVTWINEQIPHLLLIEIVLWVSIAFHAIFGVYIARTGRSNVARYNFGGNWRYALQRISGYIGIFFIFYHVATLRWGWDFLVPGGTKWSADFAASTLAAAVQGSPEGFTVPGLLVALGYFVGVSLLVFHFANGLWTAAITWGITVSRQAQARWGVACLGLGVALMGMAWASLFVTYTIRADKAQIVEQQLLDKREGPASKTTPTPPAVGDAGEPAPR
jgi:succinate dehydrogenase / fumarate reductase, cytochrome b subunit